jgi:cobalamin biosynthesis protein CobT
MVEEFREEENLLEQLLEKKKLKSKIKKYNETFISKEDILKVEDGTKSFLSVLRDVLGKKEAEVDDDNESDDEDDEKSDDSKDGKDGKSITEEIYEEDDDESDDESEEQDDEKKNINVEGFIDSITNNCEVLFSV